MPVYRLVNVIQPYAWGSKTAISELLGQPSPSDHPQAELWMGVHPKGPSRVIVDGKQISLQQLIETDPAYILGTDVVRRFGNGLPYLFKVLAAAQPLSIQAHPSKTQAETGFAREEREGKPFDAADRNYRDDNHKPEIICALTPFWALNGFRSPAEAADLLAPVCPACLEEARQRLKTDRKQGLIGFVQRMLTLPLASREAAGAEVVAKAERLDRSLPVYRWIVELARAYPADMGVLSPALLNLVLLAPRQAMYLPAGQLHAYLDGVGIELMANSDNVLRGGLTPKHVDVPELLEVVRFTETSIELLEPLSTGGGEYRYACPAEEFSLGILHPQPNHPFRSASQRNVEILLCTGGDGSLAVDGEEAFRFAKGDSVLIPAGLPPYTFHGEAEIYRATVPRLT